MKTGVTGLLCLFAVLIGVMIGMWIHKAPPHILKDKRLSEGDHTLAYISKEDIALLRKDNDYGPQLMYDVNKKRLYTEKSRVVIHLFRLFVSSEPKSQLYSRFLFFFSCRG